MRILVVEDDLQLREFLEDMLTSSGYNVALSHHGEDGLQMLQNQAFDLLITDLVMPERDGVSLIAMMKRLQPKLRIIAMSGRSKTDLDIDSLQLVRVLGADVTLQKPFSIEELEMAIAKVGAMH
ncbi:MAG: response regulator [Pseudomonadales bacterium]|nr:response regulator [Pseudomonadales bacterium]